MVFLDTPAFARSCTEAYGLPATILFAVAAPTPGRVWRSLGVAVFRSIGGTRTILAGFFDAAPATEAMTMNAQASKHLPRNNLATSSAPLADARGSVTHSERWPDLPKYAGVAQRVAARLRIDAQSMGAFADRNLGQQLTIISIDRINFLAVAAGEP